ncbi:MAG: 23S rRNA (guanosine(2251)-2'-O)-methyltransferase RlmB [Marinilabiliales bacterium]
MSEKNFIYGIRPVIEAVKAGKNFDKVLINNKSSGELMSELINTLKKHGVNFHYVPFEKLNRFTRQNHQGVIAIISPVPFFKLEYLIPGIFEKGEVPLIVILDGVTDIRNFGAICRTCETAGVHAIVVPERGSAMISADAVKTSAGAIYNIPICKVNNLTKETDFLKRSGLTIYAATEKANKLYYSVDFTVPMAIIMGSEEKGINPSLLKISDELIKIPIFGKTESLNVSVATGIVLYEAVRQRL